MPLVKRCVICGRICAKERSAKPYKDKGWACDECYISRVKPAIKHEEEKRKRKYG